LWKLAHCFSGMTGDLEPIAVLSGTGKLASASRPRPFLCPSTNLLARFARVLWVTFDQQVVDELAAAIPNIRNSVYAVASAVLSRACGINRRKRFSRAIGLCVTSRRVRCPLSPPRAASGPRGSSLPLPQSSLWPIREILTRADGEPRLCLISHRGVRSVSFAIRRPRFIFQWRAARKNHTLEIAALKAA